MERVLSATASVLAIAASVTVLFTALFGVFPTMLNRSLFLGLAMGLVFLARPMRGTQGTAWRWLDVLLALLSFACVAYLWLNFAEIIARAGLRPRPHEFAMGLVFMLLVLEVGRRTVGLVLPIIGIAFVSFSLFGPYMPGILRHRGYSLERIINHQYLTDVGIFSLPMGVYATIILLFMLFAAFLKATQAEQFFTRLSLALTGHLTGGPALTAVVASALMGTISGSPTANVATTGAFTIPLMRRVGYRADFAGAVEAAASTGGQIMPPVMGAAAFLLAEMIQVPYVEVMRAALLPAILYFVAVGAMVRFRAERTGLAALPRDELPSLRETLRQWGHLITPLLVIIYALVVARVSPMLAALWGIGATVLVSFLRSHTRLTLRSVVDALDHGARDAMPMAAACGIAGIVLGVISQTGLGVKLSMLIVDLSGGHLIPIMLLTMVAGLILGMGLPTSAAYILLASLIGGALVRMGVPPMAAHFAILYFGVLSTVTPPVALAAFVAAGLTGENPMRIAIQATKLALVAHVIPFMFVYDQALLLQGPLGTILMASVTGIIAIIALAAAMEGWLAGTSLGALERAVLMVTFVTMLWPGLATDMVGLAGLAAVWFRVQRRRAAAPATATAQGTSGRALP